MPAKICFTSLGCFRNLVDTEVMMGLVLNKKYLLTSNFKEADFFVVNTCGFIQPAREETFEVLEEIFAKKRKEAKVIVTGCMVGQFSVHLKKQFQDIFYFLGSGNIEEIIQAIESQKKSDIVTKKSYLEKEDTPRFLTTLPNFAYLKISEGCMKNCSYCLIPKIKGPLRSKPINQIVLEFKKLLKRGVFEVILIAQNLGDYGKDLPGNASLELLLRELLNVKKDFWIRLLYLYPDHLQDSLIDLIQSDSRICHYIDIPIQHVNDEILKKMKRATSKKKIIATIEKLRSKIPDIVIRSTFIVGFPGETNKQFLELVDFINTYRLDHVGIFKFSKEKETRADQLPDQILEDIKEKRLQELYLVQQKIVFEKNKNMIGKRLQVVIEKPHSHSKDLMEGRFYGQAPDVDPGVFVHKTKHFQNFYQRYLVEITDFLGYDLIGEIV